MNFGELCLINKDKNNIQKRTHIINLFCFLSIYVSIYISLSLSRNIIIRVYHLKI